MELRQEINAGLNVVENWNSANSFIFDGQGGEIATNRLEDQELAVLCLHLLQISLVYIITLMIQLMQYSHSHDGDIVVHFVSGSQGLWSQLRSLSWAEVELIVTGRVIE